MKVSIILLLLLASLARAEDGLVNSSYVRGFLTKNAYWGHLHGASHEDLGAGMLYYSLVYANKSKRCVCLGSGDGFVPRVMKQAQRDLNLEAETILIDGNVGRWGRPKWLHSHSFFRSAFSDIQVILDTTQSAVKSFAKDWRIDYLHIDAERTVQGALQDFIDYLPFMEKNSVVTIHDTGPQQPCSYVVPLIQEMGYAVINFETLGTGVALIYPKGTPI